jgi:hypothetical protein
MGDGGYSSINPDLGTMEMSGQLHAPAVLHPGKEPSVLIGWVAPRTGLDFVD